MACNIAVSLLNDTGSAAVAGEVVQISDTNPNAFKLADASTASNADGIGVLISDVAAAASGPVELFGGPVSVLLENGLTPVNGQGLYVSRTVPGRATNVKPTENPIPIGVITNAAPYVTVTSPVVFALIGISQNRTQTQNNIEIGPEATAAAVTSAAIGAGANIDAGSTSGIAFGTSAILTGSSVGGIAIGGSALVDTSTNGIAIGVSASVASAVGGIAIGGSADVNSGATNSIAIGSAAATNGADQIAIGRSANAGGGTAADSICIGRTTSVDNTSLNGIAIGVGAGVTGASHGIAIGPSAGANGAEAIAIGNTATAAAGGIAMGRDASAAANTLQVGSTTAAGNINEIVVTGASVGASTVTFRILGAGLGNDTTGLFIPVDRSGVETKGVQVQLGAANTGPGGAGRALFVAN